MVHSGVKRRGWVGPQQTLMGDNSGRIRKGITPKSWTEEITHMDNYIIERRARVRLAWFKRYEEIENIRWVCREFGISRKTFYKWWPLLTLGKVFPGLRIALSALRAILRPCRRKLPSSS